MTLENWAANRWLEKLASDQEEIERLLANADGHLDDYRKAVKSEMSADAQLSLAYDAIRASATAALRAAGCFYSCQAAHIRSRNVDELMISIISFPSSLQGRYSIPLGVGSRSLKKNLWSAAGMQA